ncbi:FtsQ-type POTRA domain-containing protein [Sphingorhabdus soli]|uniref:Cell division protein FtsQ n=1 Tax=Flavisphingopyxis soli TaxID=2601267 RepID=A0A5C6UAF3_9SPHN|nr:cell division protein FtsQ/DivIB [Sphingorhabdus soli]TXC68735.1 FtsQ-type POTRA domain-containing protein [Sphingorhabdus soli]
MTTAKIKRGKRAKPAPRRKPARRKTQGSRVDAVLGALPVSRATLQRIATLVILSLLVVLVVVAANVSGVSAKIAEEAEKAVGRAGFEVRRVEVVGVDRIDQAKVYEIALNQRNRSMAAVDLDEVRRDLMQYGWIADARVSRRLPDTLVVDIVERTPSAVWQNNRKLALIDKNGVVLERVNARNAPDLPLVIGPNANRQTKQLDKLLDEVPALRPLVAGATWVGNRRWDLRFQSGETLALPEGDGEAKAALIDFARMDGANRLLGRGIVRFDMRDPDKFVFLPGERVAAKPVDKPAADSGEE